MSAEGIPILWAGRMSNAIIAKNAVAETATYLDKLKGTP